jgi:hypothetical protein
VTESTGMMGSNRVSFKNKIRSVAFGAVATAALSIPAVSALSVTAHDAGRKPVFVTPSSHRLALTVHPNSVRLT